MQNILQYISQGVYVIGVSDGDKTNAFTATWVMQVSFSPVLLAISINPEHYSYQLLKRGSVCSVNVLSRKQMQLATHFGKPGGVDKMCVGNWTVAMTGAPILQESIAYFDCKMCDEIVAGDHQLVVCQVLEARHINAGDVMLYSHTGNMDNSAELY